MNPSASWAKGLPGRISEWSAERQCVVHLIRVALGAELDPALKLRCADIQIPQLMQEIQRHRVGAYLAHRVPKDVVSLFPRALGVRLKRVASQTQLNALRQTAGLVRITNLLAQAGLRVMSLKGPLLAQALHGNQGVRHAGDIDLSISESDVWRVDAVLRENGFRRTHPAGEMTPRRWKNYTKVWRDCEYVKLKGNQPIEVMWRLANNDALQAQAMAGSPAEHVVGGHPIQALPEDVHGVYLLVHGATHGWCRLFWLIDIAMLMRSESVDWNRMRDLAVATGVYRHFWQGLGLARELLGVELPAGLGQGPISRELDKNMADAYWQMGLLPAERNFGASHYRLGVYARRLMPDWGLQWRELSKRWISPENWDALPLSDRWFALYYVVWPLLWAGRQLAKRLRPKSPRSPAGATD